MRAALLCALCLLAGCAPTHDYILVCTMDGRETFRSRPTSWRPELVYKQGNVWGTGSGRYTPRGGELCDAYTVPPQVERAP